MPDACGLAFRAAGAPSVVPFTPALCGSLSLGCGPPALLPAPGCSSGPSTLPCLQCPEADSACRCPTEGEGKVPVGGVAPPVAAAPFPRSTPRGIHGEKLSSVSWEVVENTRRRVAPAPGFLPSGLGSALFGVLCRVLVLWPQLPAQEKSQACAAFFPKWRRTSSSAGPGGWFLGLALHCRLKAPDGPENQRSGQIVTCCHHWSLSCPWITPQCFKAQTRFIINSKGQTGQYLKAEGGVLAGGTSHWPPGLQMRCAPP